MNEKLKPTYLAPLKKGDTIAIVASGKTISKNEIKLAVKTYTKWGLQVVLGETIGAKTNYFAGSDKLRLADLQSVLDNPKIKAVFFARGGYGTVRILPQLNPSGFIKHPKWLIGFSDVTAIHAWLAITTKNQSIHGIMPVFFPTTHEEAISSCKDTLFNGIMNYHLPLNSKYNINGSCKAAIIGGNLSVIASLCGTPYQIRTKGKILFLEDLGEHYYHIDRMLQTLKLNGLFKQLKGVIIGGFTQMNEGNPVFAKNIEEVIFPYFKELAIPLVFDFPAGHITDNRSIIFGQKTHLEVTNKSVILKTVK